jgi:diguanylate cyclase (GGDEF)-like protein
LEKLNLKTNNKKIVIIISLLLFSGFLGTSLISYFVSRASIVNLIKMNDLPLTSDNIYSEIQRDLLQPILISSFMSRDTFLRDWVVKGEVNVEQVNKYLKEIKTKYNAFTSFFVSDKTYYYYHSDGILKKIKNGEERDKWYFRVKNMKEEYEINVDPDMANRDTMTIFINYKVYDYDGKFIGATGVGLNASAVKQLIKDYQRRYDCNIYFVNSSGDIILRSSELFSEGKNIKDIDGLGDIAQTVFSSKSGSYSYFNNWKTTHLYTRYIPEFKWYLFVEQTEGRAVKSIIYTLGVNLAICIIISGVIIFIAHLTLSRYQGHLEQMAVTDKLTGVYNRQVLDVSLDLAMKEYVRHQKQFSVVIMDIDRFKKINDSLGHLAGDAVLCHVTDRIKMIIRDIDILSRWGGDEFIIVLNNCTRQNAVIIAEKIRNDIKSNPVLFNGSEIVFSISLGVTQCLNDDSINAVISRADRALYSAKENGRDRVESL